MAYPFSQVNNRIGALLVDLSIDTNTTIYLTTSWFSVTYNGNVYQPNRYLENSFTWQDTLDDNQGTTTLNFLGEDPAFNALMINSTNTGLPLNVYYVSFNALTYANIGTLTLHKGIIVGVSAQLDYSQDGKDKYFISVSTKTIANYLSERPLRTATSPTDYRLFSPSDSTMDNVGSETNLDILVTPNASASSARIS